DSSGRGRDDPASAAEAGSIARSVAGGDACLRTRSASIVSQQTKTTMVRGCFTAAAWFSTPRLAGDSSDSTRRWGGGDYATPSLRILSGNMASFGSNPAGSGQGLERRERSHEVRRRSVPGALDRFGGERREGARRQ